MARGRCPYVTCRSVKYTNHRRVRRPRRPLRWMTDNVFTTRKRSQSTVGEGFHALPAWNEGQRRFARLKWCAGCARGICIRWAVDGGGRAVGDTGATRQAQRVRLTRLGNPASTGRRGRRPLRAVARRTLRHTTRRMRLPHAHQWCAGCARGIGYVGLWMEAGAPRGTRMLSVTLNVCG